ncbi:hypothetical protein C3492_36395 [Streptomyces sp. Ru62]|uniref:hypothetical protein n=1 Tax=Streptomyces sp. Ru62 TaxID=2080745 RepID=UPI000CDDDF42|nr:hypothetical protein [Streptomyces sp. Ru62]POX58699.1 hypothetical protein C3492_36395 [Streptomyces sp. Ru62]
MSEDDNRPQLEDKQPDEPGREAAAEPEATEEESGAPGFRLDPSVVAKVDMTRLLSFQAAARQYSEQIASQFASLAAAGDRLRAMQQDFVKSAAPSLAALVQRRDGLAEQMRQAARIALPLPRYDFGADLGRVLDANRQQWVSNIRRLVEFVTQLIPDNLRGLQAEKLVEVFKVNVEDGTSLAWAPRTSIVEQLIEVPDMEARGVILVTHASEIADDIDASLAVVALPEHQDLKSMLLEATAAIRAGLYRPAQAAACAVFDTVVNEHMLKHLAYTGRKTKDKTRNHFRPIEVSEWDDASFAEVGLVLVGAGISTAFQHWDRGIGQASFNRNGSTHQVDDGSYSSAHAVRAALIAHATLRWLDEALAAEQDEGEAA